MEEPHLAPQHGEVVRKALIIVAVVAAYSLLETGSLLSVMMLHYNSVHG